MIPAFPVSTFDNGFTPEFTAYLRKHGLSFDKVSTIDKSDCRIAETYPKVVATFGKYSAKQGAKPLSKPQVEGMRI